MVENDFVFKGNQTILETAKVRWKAPSNIALVKYWGKKNNQIPANPSISFTLDACATRTTLDYRKKMDGKEGFSFELFFEGKRQDSFKPKIQTFFERVENYLPFLRDYHFTIETSNSFPHSSGIASSASGMAALALCLMSIEQRLYPEISADYFYKKASFLARLGSGSACRSIQGNLVQWGETTAVNGSSDLFGIADPFPVHPSFKTYHDTILLVHKGQKTVSSSVGHQLMHNHPYASNRFLQAHQNLKELKEIMISGDLEGFTHLVESEALTLHAMMMTSSPYFILMKPATLEIINRVWNFRKRSSIPLCFTLDAGANVHLLYPQEVKKKTIQFIQDELVAYCENGHYICDMVGAGAKEG